MTEEEPVKTSILSKRNLIILFAIMIAGFFALMFIRKWSPFVGSLVKQTPLEETYVGIENIWSQGILTDPTRLGAFSTLSIGGIGTLVTTLLSLKKAAENKATQVEATHLTELHELERSWQSKLGSLQTQYDQVNNAKNVAEAQVSSLKGEIDKTQGAIKDQASKIKAMQTQYATVQDQLTQQGKSLQGALDENGRLTKTLESVKRSSADMLTKERTLHQNELSSLEASKSKTLEELQIKLGAEQQKNKTLTDLNNRLRTIRARATVLAGT